MREIKFRAWGHFGSNTKDSMIENWQSSEYVEYVGFNGGESFTIMQFTGLKDKNGKEIYECDQLLYRCKSSVIEGEVYLAHGCWKIRDKRGGNVMYLYKASSLEVVGNIYENPDLMELNG